MAVGLAERNLMLSFLNRSINRQKMTDRRSEISVKQISELRQYETIREVEWIGVESCVRVGAGRRCMAFGLTKRDMCTWHDLFFAVML